MADRNHALTIGAVTVLVAVLLAGCQGDPEPKFDPDAELSSGSSPVSASPTESASAKPLDPVQTVRAWIAAQNDVMATGETDAVEELSTADCTTCDDLIDPVVEVHQKGGRFETEGWKVTAISKSPKWPKVREVTAGIDLGSGRTWARKGAKPVNYGSEKRVVRFTLEMVRGKYLVEQIVLLR